MEVYKAINNVQRALSKTGISKDRTNTQGSGYKFRGIDDVYNAVAPLLAEYGLCILPRMISRLCDERQSKAGSALFYVTVEAEFDFVSAADGSKHTVRTFGEAMDSGDKATNKAMSAAYKYAAFQAFAIPTEADNDADAQTHQVEPRSRGDDALASFSPAKAKVIRQAAQNALQKFNEGDELGAYEECSSLWDKYAIDEQGVIDESRRNMVKMALSTIFGPHSALRSSLKKHAEAERAGAAVA